MEDFFIDDKFYMDLDSLITDLDLHEDGAIEALEEDWIIKVQLGELQPMFKVTAEILTDYLCDANEERFPEDGDQDMDIKKALLAAVDFEKLNSMIPKLYYGGKNATITKADLIEYIS